MRTRREILKFALGAPIFGALAGVLGLKMEEPTPVKYLAPDGLDEMRWRAHLYKNVTSKHRPRDMMKSVVTEWQGYYKREGQPEHIGYFRQLADGSVEKDGGEVVS